MAEDMRRYKPDFSGFDVEPLRQFCQDFVDGNLKVWFVILLTDLYIHLWFYQ